MNATEAKKIIERLRSYSNPEDIDCEDCGDGREAHGYLEALRGEEVRELVKWIGDNGSHKSATCFEYETGCICGFKELLEKFREAVK